MCCCRPLWNPQTAALVWISLKLCFVKKQFKSLIRCTDVSVSSGQPGAHLFQLTDDRVGRQREGQATESAKQQRHTSVPGTRLRKDVRQYFSPLLPRCGHPLQEAVAGDVRGGVQTRQGHLYRLRQPTEFETVLLYPHGQQTSGHPTADGHWNAHQVSEYREMTGGGGRHNLKICL